MDMLRCMFGCTNKSDVHAMVKRIFGDDMIMKDSSDEGPLRTNYIMHIKENLPKVLENKILKHNPQLAKRIDSQNSSSSPDDRSGRIGSRMVVFDATIASGRLLLAGDERVNVQALSNFATIRATACVYAGKWMYEVQIGTKGIMQVGWCTAECQFSSDAGVGDTISSYSYDGSRVRKWNVATSKYGDSWLPGDVIGSVIDLDRGTVEFFRNGKSLGVAFENISRGSGVAYFPAVSLAAHEHLYANFGHMPFVFPVDKAEPMQISPERECMEADLLLSYLELLVDEKMAIDKCEQQHDFIRNLAQKQKLLLSKTGSIISKKSNDSAHPSIQRQVAKSNSNETIYMSKKAFVTFIARLILMELSKLLRTSYIIVKCFLPMLRYMIGLPSQRWRGYAPSRAIYLECSKNNFVNLSKRLVACPHKKLCLILDWVWAFVDEAAVITIFNHCLHRESLVYDLVAADLTFKRQIECVYFLCGLMQHPFTRLQLVKHVLFARITFDYFLNVTCPEDDVVKSVLRKIWWKQPTPVVDETDPKIEEEFERTSQKGSAKEFTTAKSSMNSGVESKDSRSEKEYYEDCDALTAAVIPLENIQVEYLLLLLEDSDGGVLTPSTRKVFLEKFHRYVMDYCILDMVRDSIDELRGLLKMFNITRNTPSMYWCCHSRLLTATLRLCDESEDPTLNAQAYGLPVVTPLAFVDTHMDFYSVDRLGGVMPYLVRSYKPELVRLLGENHVFLRSYEPTYNRNGGVDTAVNETEAAGGIPGAANLADVMSSLARFISQNSPNNLMTTVGGTSLAVTGGGVDVNTTVMKLIDGLLAMYHGGAHKHAEKICEVRDNHLDLADCLYDIETRIMAVGKELAEIDETINLRKCDTKTILKRDLIDGIYRELLRSKAVYEERLTWGCIAVSWIRGVWWSRSMQSQLCKLAVSALRTLIAALRPNCQHIAFQYQRCPILSVKKCMELYILYAALKSGSEEILPEQSTILQHIESSQSSLVSENGRTPIEIRPLSDEDRNVTPKVQCPEEDESSSALFAFVPVYYVEAALELCNTLRLYMPPTMPTSSIPEWHQMLIEYASFLCEAWSDQRVVLSSTRESLIQTLASFTTQPHTMRAIEMVGKKQQMIMVRELLRPYSNRSWAQSNWVLVRFWHGTGFGYRHRQWPHLAQRYGDREPTVTNLGAKVDAGLMSQCFGPCPSEVIQGRIREYLRGHPEEAASFLNSLLTQLNWAFSEFFNLIQEMDRVSQDVRLEPRQIKLCASCFDLYHGLMRSLEMTLHLAPELMTNASASNGQHELLLMRTIQTLLAVLSRVTGVEGACSRVLKRRLPELDRVHYYVALAPVAGSLTQLIGTDKPDSQHIERTLTTEALFKMDYLLFMVGRGSPNIPLFSFYDYPEAITTEELQRLESMIAKVEQGLSESRASSSNSSRVDSCPICYARRANVTFIPCGHTSCRSCVQQHLLHSKLCFFCKAEIERIESLHDIKTE